jgi:dipeptidyl aminopeptidase/acylaminoacyl peptidase
MYETARQPYGLDLSPDGSSIIMGVTTRAQVPNDREEWLRGLIAIRADGAESVLAPLGPKDVYYARSPMESRSGTGAFVQVTNHWQPGPIHLSRESGEVVKMTGLGENTAFIDWTPDGGSLLVHVTQDNDGSQSSRAAADNGLFLVPVADGPVQLVATAVKSWGPWSPDGEELPVTVGDTLHLFDRPSGKLHAKALGTALLAGSVRWSRDGAYLLLGSSLVDAASGRVTADLGVQYVASAAVSADGRYFLASEEVQLTQPPKPCLLQGGLRNRTHMYDTLTGQSSILLDCDRGYFFVGPELQSGDGMHRILLRTLSCTQCDGALTSISLLTLETAEILPLSPPGAWNGYVVAPDRSQVALTGEAPRIISSGGALLEEIDLPTGTAVYDFEFAPGGGYFYLLGPKQLDLL